MLCTKLTYDFDPQEPNEFAPDARQGGKSVGFIEHARVDSDARASSREWVQRKNGEQGPKTQCQRGLEPKL